MKRSSGHTSGDGGKSRTINIKSSPNGLGQPTGTVLEQQPTTKKYGQKGTGGRRKSGSQGGRG